jgi:hypothetical protein
MNVQPIQVDYFAATTAYSAYRKAIKDNRATKDDVALARAYHAMLRGKKVIDIGVAIGGAGVDSQFRPKLAIARADWLNVYARRDDDGKFHISARWVKAGPRCRVSRRSSGRRAR